MNALLPAGNGAVTRGTAAACWDIKGRSKRLIYRQFRGSERRRRFKSHTYGYGAAALITNTGPTATAINRPLMPPDSEFPHLHIPSSTHHRPTAGAPLLIDPPARRHSDCAIGGFIIGCPDCVLTCCAACGGIITGPPTTYGRRGVRGSRDIARALCLSAF